MQIHGPRGDAGHEPRGDWGFETKGRRPATQVTGFVRCSAFANGGLHVPLLAAGIRDDRRFVGDAIDIRWYFVRTLCAERTLTENV
jgi:hypothetical protein